MKLFVLRHGETQLNKKRKFYGSLNVPLDNKGIQQANEVAKKLIPFTFDRIVTSEMLRAKQTVAPILKSHPQNHLVIDGRFNEMGFGNWEGLDADEIQAMDPVTWQKWLSDPFAVTPENGEQFKQFKERVLCAMESYCKEPAVDNMLLVAHLGVLRALHHFWFPNSNYWDTNFLAGSYSVYTLSSHRVEIDMYNV